MKGVNSTAVGDGIFDLGGDGKAGGGNGNIGRDAYGFSLNYFSNDYNPIVNANTFVKISVANDLFNGNINAMAVNLPKLDTAKVYGYNYDQLNRLVAMDAYNGLNNATNIFTPASIDDYKERIAYDANGNIQKYLRHGTTSGGTALGMDSLSYKYFRNADGTLRNNRLRMVRDTVREKNYAQDIDDQLASVTNAADSNYVYDAIGNLIKDKAEKKYNITWTVYEKINAITKTDSTKIIYTYDASGNRISKTVKPYLQASTETYYVSDASGNVMSIYTKDVSINIGDLTQTEIHLYGSSKLGVYNLKNNVQDEDPNPGRIINFTRGNKFFELSNHLGNVLATVSDKKLQHSSDNTTIDYFTADVVSANDYYPFGMLMPGRKYSVAKTNYRYGFNGKELDKEVAGTTTYDYGFRIYNPGLGKFLSVDPLQMKHQDETPYLFSGANPIAFSDPDGRDRIIATTTIYDFGQGNVVSFVSRRVVKEDFIISQTKNQNGTVHYLYMDTNEQHVSYKNLATGEQKNFSSISYSVRFKSNYNSKELTGKIGRGWEKFGAWFNNLVQEGHEGYHEGGGIMFTSKIGQGTDRGPKRKFIDAEPVNIDLMVETIGQLNTTTGYEKTKDILNILERFVGKIETGKNLREEIEKLKKEVADTAPTSSQKSDSRTTTSGKDFKPDSIFVREQWERRASDGTIIESGDSSKKVVNPDKNTKNK